MDVSKNLCHGEHKLFVGMKEHWQLFCVSIYKKYYQPHSMLKIVKMW